VKRKHPRVPTAPPGVDIVYNEAHRRRISRLLRQRTLKEKLLLERAAREIEEGGSS
jgi:hypothetical protein